MENMDDRSYIKLLTVPAVKTGTVTSDACDTEGYQGASFHVIYGDSGDTLSASVYWTAKLQSCATEGGTYADVGTDGILIASANSFGLINAPTEDQKLYHIGYNGTDRWVKVVVTATGTHTNGTIITIIADLGMPRTQTLDGAVNP
jgi:hypothetical protein